MKPGRKDPNGSTVAIREYVIALCYRTSTILRFHRRGLNDRLRVGRNGCAKIGRTFSIYFPVSSGEYLMRYTYH
jgi:hypothetical protein